MKRLAVTVVPEHALMVVKKLGQPVPLSNFIAEVKKRKPQPATRNPGRFSRSTGSFQRARCSCRQHFVGPV